MQLKSIIYPFTRIQYLEFYLLVFSLMQLATCMAVHEDLNRGGDLVEQLSSPNKIYLQ